MIKREFVPHPGLVKLSKPKSKLADYFYNQNDFARMDAEQIFLLLNLELARHKQPKSEKYG